MQRQHRKVLIYMEKLKFGCARIGAEARNRVGIGHMQQNMKHSPQKTRRSYVISFIELSEWIQYLRRYKNRAVKNRPGFSA